MKILVAMSGGVDSSVTAKLLKDEGYDCIGCTMRLYENNIVGKDLLDTCCSLKDTEDARSVTKNIGIPYYIYHYENIFQEKVIDSFVSNYEQGYTPNPCIECNRHLKFKYLFEKMLSSNNKNCLKPSSFILLISLITSGISLFKYCPLYKQ